MRNSTRERETFSSILKHNDCKILIDTSVLMDDEFEAFLQKYQNIIPQCGVIRHKTVDDEIIRLFNGKDLEKKERAARAIKLLECDSCKDVFAHDIVFDLDNVRNDVNIIRYVAMHATEFNIIILVQDIDLAYVTLYIHSVIKNICAESNPSLWCIRVVQGGYAEILSLYNPKESSRYKIPLSPDVEQRLKSYFEKKYDVNIKKGKQ